MSVMTPLPRHINQSQLKAWRDCQKRWYFRYKLKLVPRHQVRPLFVGSWVHACLETHYRDGDWRIGFREFKKNYDSLFDEERDALDRGRKKYISERLPSQVARIVKSYLWYYRNEEFKAVVVERTFEIQVKDIIFKGRIDVAWQDAEGRLWMVDHKTAASIPPATAFHAMDPQLMLYPYAAQKLWGMDFAGVIWNYVKSRPPSIPKITKAGAISKQRIVTDYPTAKRFLVDSGFDPADFSDYLAPMRKKSDFLRRYRLPREDHVLKQILKEAVITGREINTDRPSDQYIRNITKDCAKCSYLTLCRADLEGGDVEYLAKKYYKEEEDPSLGSASSEFEEDDDGPDDED